MMIRNRDNLRLIQPANPSPSRHQEGADIHCHCLAGIDDGPADLDQAVELCRALVADGISRVVATPHQLGRYEGRNSAATIRRAVCELETTLAANGVPLTVLPGADVRVHEGIVDLLERDEILTLADGGKYLLLELPTEVFLDLGPMVKQLHRSGITAVISHPERHNILAHKPQAVAHWRLAGAVFQITAGSLVGTFGRSAQQAAWKWLDAGAVSLVATDAHSTTDRPPQMRQAVEAIAGRMGYLLAHRICLQNPARVIEGRPLLTPISAAGLEGRA